MPLKLSASGKAQFERARVNGGPAFTDLAEAAADNSLQITRSPPVWGIFPLLSRFNHSCLPNAWVPFDVASRQDSVPSTSEVRATRDIDPGDEIAYCYGDVSPAATACGSGEQKT